MRSGGFFVFARKMQPSLPGGSLNQDHRDRAQCDHRFDGANGPAVGKSTARALQKALQLFPSQHALLARKRDHGRAESALLVVASLEHAA
jgi:hypothetical protein